MPSPDPEDLVCVEAGKSWDLQRLYADLATAKQRKLSPGERKYLCYLLCGYSLIEIAEALHIDANGLRVALSNTLYSYIGTLTGQRPKHWQVTLILEKAGYKRQPEPAVRSLAPLLSLQVTPLHNLPTCDFASLIGREQELSMLLNVLTAEPALYSYPVHCISIEGMGGMGKTTLALAAAYRCLQAALVSPAAEQRTHLPIFDAIIYTSAKPRRLTSSGIFPRLCPDTTLQGLFQTIACTLQCPHLLLATFEDQVQHVWQLLARQRTLLIIDNLETVADPQTTIAFLHDLPPTVKVVITSRLQTPFFRIPLEPLPENTGIQLILYQAEVKRVALTSQQAQQLYRGTNGIPAAIVYAIGQLAAGYPLKQVPARLHSAQGDYCRFYFEGSIMPLHGSLTHQVLMTLALFGQSASEEALMSILADHFADPADPDRLIQSLVTLQQLSLVQQQQGRYTMLPLTQEYVRAELRSHPEFEQQVRERWVAWYQQLAETAGGKDWKEWQDYTALEQEWENLQAVIEWCIAHDRYADVQRFWRNVNGYTHAQGYRGDRLTHWQVRLDWTDWLLHRAEQQQDWQTALEMMFDQGWTLTLLGQPEYFVQADALYGRAWELRQYKDARFQANLSIHIAVLKIEQQQFAVALEWLDRAELMLRSSAEPAQRQQIQQLYYRGEVAYKTADYLQAMRYFQQVLQRAEAIGWQRAVFLAKDWLADLAMQQEDLDQAEQFLQEGLQAAMAQHDQCRTAFCQRSLARLARQRGQGQVALAWAESAKQGFEQLGMQMEAQETIEFIQAMS